MMRSRNRRIPLLFARPGGKIIPFITAGFPSLELTVPLVRAAEKAGAQMVELGMPFSDPLADGPVIQAASQQALKNGVTPKWILNTVKTIRRHSVIPLVLMGYINPILSFGLEKFARECSDAGVDGLIIPDLPPEEADEWVHLCRYYGISPILLVAPNTPDQRIAMISQMAEDLIYCVAILGITGTQKADKKGLQTYLNRVRVHSRTPFVVGFGIRNHADVTAIHKQASGAVIGSELLKRIDAAEDPVREMGKFIKQVKG